jgi:hypothetical protein
VQVSREGSVAFDDVDVSCEMLEAAGYQCAAASSAGSNA